METPPLTEEGGGMWLCCTAGFLSASRVSQPLQNHSLLSQICIELWGVVTSICAQIVFLFFCLFLTVWHNLGKSYPEYRGPRSATTDKNSTERRVLWRKSSYQVNPWIYICHTKAVIYFACSTTPLELSNRTSKLTTAKVQELKKSYKIVLCGE